MWDQPYLETCCRSALHRLLLAGGAGRPADLKDAGCLRRLEAKGLAEPRADGRAAVALHQMSELLVVPGVTIVGVLPAEIQNHTVYAGAIATQAPQAQAARRLLAMLAGPEGASVLRKRGMEPPNG